MDITPIHKVRRYRGRLVLQSLERAGQEPSRRRLENHATALFAPRLRRGQILAVVDAAERLLRGEPEPWGVIFQPRGRLDGPTMRERAEEYLLENPEAPTADVLEYVEEWGTIPVEYQSFLNFCSRVRTRLRRQEAA